MPFIPIVSAGAGGAVVWAGTWRVGGVLAVSRSFGNRMMKQVGGRGCVRMGSCTGASCPAHPAIQDACAWLLHACVHDE